MSSPAAPTARPPPTRSSLVIGLDAVDILASTTTAASCLVQRATHAGGTGILEQRRLDCRHDLEGRSRPRLRRQGQPDRQGRLQPDVAPQPRVELEQPVPERHARRRRSSAVCSDGDHSVEHRHHDRHRSALARVAPRRDLRHVGCLLVDPRALAEHVVVRPQRLRNFAVLQRPELGHGQQREGPWPGVRERRPPGTFNPHAQFTGPGGVLDTSDPNYPNCLTTANGGSPNTTNAKSCHRAPPARHQRPPGRTARRTA